MCIKVRSLTKDERSVENKNMKDCARACEILKKKCTYPHNIKMRRYTRYGEHLQGCHSTCHKQRYALFHDVIPPCHLGPCTV